MIDLGPREPPLDLVFSRGSFAIVNLVPETLAQIDAPAVAARALVRHHPLDGLAVHRDRGHASTPLVLVGTWSVVCKAIPLSWKVYVSYTVSSIYTQCNLLCAKAKKSWELVSLDHPQAPVP